MARTSSVVSRVLVKWVCLAALGLQLSACSSSSSNGGGGGMAGEGSVISGAGTTSGTSAGATGQSGATSASGGATGASGGATGASGATSGNPDFVADCTSLITAECHQIYACVSATDRAADPSVGTTEAECVSMFADCSAGTSPCDPGFTFHADQFTTCVTAVKALSCPDFIAAQGTPNECATVCQ